MECIIFIGIQATGKSSFYMEKFFKTHLRINLDMLKTRNRERILVEAIAEAKQPVVIDNTNPLPEDRAKYIEVFKPKKFDIIGYYFKSSIEEAKERNEKRQGKECIPLPGILNTYNKLELPSYDEGFDKLYYVSIENDTFVVEEWDDEI